MFRSGFGAATAMAARITRAAAYRSGTQKVIQYPCLTAASERNLATEFGRRHEFVVNPFVRCCVTPHSSIDGEMSALQTPFLRHRHAPGRGRVNAVRNMGAVAAQGPNGMPNLSTSQTQYENAESEAVEAAGHNQNETNDFSLVLTERCIARLREIQALREKQQTSTTQPADASTADGSGTEQGTGQIQGQGALLVALRVSVDSGGCSGFQYNFKLESSETLVPLPDDQVVEKNGVRVLVDSVSAPLLNGAIIDYEQELMRSAFIVGTNPNSDTGCSCGVSFAPKL